MQPWGRTTLSNCSLFSSFIKQKTSEPLPTNRQKKKSRKTQEGMMEDSGEWLPFLVLSALVLPNLMLLGCKYPQHTSKSKALPPPNSQDQFVFVCNSRPLHVSEMLSFRSATQQTPTHSTRSRLNVPNPHTFPDLILLLYALTSYQWPLCRSYHIPW